MLASQPPDVEEALPKDKIILMIVPLHANRIFLYMFLMKISNMKR